MANLDLCLGGIEPIYPPGPGRWVNVIPLEATKNGNFVAPDGYAFSPVGVNVDNSIKDVTFYDYDGSVIASYTAEDFLALEEMPSNPEHEGLVAQGWNWSLSDAKAHVTKYGELNIGQMYTTDDGKTRLYMSRTVSGNTFSIYIKQTAPRGVTIDWGDGTQTVSSTSTSTTKYEHTYSSELEPVITLEVTNGTAVIGGTAVGGKTVLLKKLEVGDNITSIASSAFAGCNGLKYVSLPNTLATMEWACFDQNSSLQHINIPNSIQRIERFSFRYCYNMRTFSLPKGIESVGESAFSNIYPLYKITLPDGIQRIDTSCFTNSYNISRINIPDTITLIGTQAFTSCYSLTDIYVYSTIPPTYVYANTFPTNAQNFLIHVPAESVDAYKAASGWSNFADNIVPM